MAAKARDARTDVELPAGALDDDDKIEEDADEARAIRLEDGSIFSVAYLAGVRLYNAGAMAHVQVLLSVFPEWQTHFSTRNTDLAIERVAYLSSLICDSIVEPPAEQSCRMHSVCSTDAFVPRTEVPAAAERPDPRAHMWDDNSGWTKNTGAMANPYAVKKPLKVSIAPNPGGDVTGEGSGDALDVSLLPSGRWADSVTLEPKAVT